MTTRVASDASELSGSTVADRKLSMKRPAYENIDTKWLLLLCSWEVQRCALLHTCRHNKTCYRHQVVSLQRVLVTALATQTFLHDPLALLSLPCDLAYARSLCREEGVRQPTYDALCHLFLRPYC